MQYQYFQTININFDLFMVQTVNFWHPVRLFIGANGQFHWPVHNFSNHSKFSESMGIIKRHTVD